MTCVVWDGSRRVYRRGYHSENSVVIFIHNWVFNGWCTVGAGSHNCLFPRSDRWWSSGPTLCQFYLWCESTVRNTPMMSKEWEECWLRFGISQCRPIITSAWWNGISPFQGQYASSCPAMHTYIEVLCDSDIAQHVGSHNGSLKKFLSFIWP